MGMVRLTSVQEDREVFGVLRDGLLEDYILATHQQWDEEKSKMVALGEEAEGPESDDWDWPRKYAEQTENHRFFAIEYKGRTQGLMQVDVGWQAVHVDGRTRAITLYIEHLESAPWNLERYVGKSGKLIGGAGPNLILAAGRLSTELGFMGRLELHSLPESLSFYRQLKQGTVNVFHDLGLGWQPYPELHYFATA